MEAVQRSFTFLDLHLYSFEQTEDPDSLFEKYASNINYVYFLPADYKKIFIMHAARDYDFVKDGVRFIIYKSHFGSAFRTLQLLFKVRGLKPNVILLHGFNYPQWIIISKLIVGRGTKVMLQSHLDRPGGWKKRWLQKLADNCIDAYLFVRRNQADEFLMEGIIKGATKVHEVMEGSTTFRVKNRDKAREDLGAGKNTIFLWVGRLNAIKDPLTILRAFYEYTKTNSEALLWMVYSAENLLTEVRSFIEIHHLKNKVILKGFIRHDDLEQYYNASDYFVAGSHFEAAGYAVCEAMACGCIPIVTKIPSFEWMTEEGECGFLFSPGDHEELLEIFKKLKTSDIQNKRRMLLHKFEKDLSFGAIARQMDKVIGELISQRDS